MRLLVAAALLVLVSACGSDPQAPTVSPEDTVEQFLASMEAGRCDDVKELVVTPSAVDCDLVGVLSGSFAEEGIELADVTYRAGEVEGDSSSVTVSWPTDEPDDSYEVERIDGVWKVMFDSVE